MNTPYDPKTTPWQIREHDFPHKGGTARLAFLIRYALLAPSSHNTQPWRFSIGQNRIQVFVDKTRWLKVADQDQRELHVSLGCALENLLLAGIVLITLFPSFSIAAARTMGSDPWKSLGLGLALLVTTPIAAVLLLATLIGMPLGFATLALYFVTLLTGFLTGILFLGDLGVRRLRPDTEPSTGWKIGALAIALVVLWLLQSIGSNRYFSLFSAWAITVTDKINSTTGKRQWLVFE